VNEEGNAYQQAGPNQEKSPILNIVRAPGYYLMKRSGVVVFNILESIIIGCPSLYVLIDEDVFRSQRRVGRATDQTVINALKPLVTPVAPVNIEAGRVEFTSGFPGNLN
jgi:hypothetical protein